MERERLDKAKQKEEMRFLDKAETQIETLLRNVNASQDLIYKHSNGWREIPRANLENLRTQIKKIIEDMSGICDGVSFTKRLDTKGKTIELEARIWMHAYGSARQTNLPKDIR